MIMIMIMVMVMIMIMIMVSCGETHLRLPVSCVSQLSPWRAKDANRHHDLITWATMATEISPLSCL